GAFERVRGQNLRPVPRHQPLDFIGLSRCLRRAANGDRAATPRNKFRAKRADFGRESVMTKDETKKILVLISGVYQAFQVQAATLEIWHEIFKDFDYRDVSAACFAYFRGENSFSPVPGNILA